MDNLNEEVVLFPLRSHDPAVKVLRIARVSEGKLDDQSVQHIAGGPYKGIIISKSTQEFPSRDRPHAVREFLAYVHDANSIQRSNKRLRERRKVFMWFKNGNYDKEQIADQFFKTLIDPDQFPKDYVSFVKKATVMAKGYHMIRTLELELSPALDEYGSPPSCPGYRTSWIEKPESVEDKEVATESPKKTKGPKPAPPPRTSRLSQSRNVNSVESDVIANNPEITRDRCSPLRTDDDAQQTDITVQGDSRDNRTATTTDEYNDAVPYAESRTSPERRTPEQNSAERDPEVIEITVTQHIVTESMTSPPPATTICLNQEDPPPGYNQESINRVQEPEPILDHVHEPAPILDHVHEPEPSLDHVQEPTLDHVQEPEPTVDHVQEPEPTVDHAQEPEPTPDVAQESAEELSVNNSPPAESEMSEEQLARRLLVLGALEDAFPNALGNQQMASATRLSVGEIDEVLAECSRKGLVQGVAGARWIRISTVRRKPKTDARTSSFMSSRISSTCGSKHDFQVVPQMPILPEREQPTVAVITLLYCEKQAVDAMMESKTTYVRYKTEGEGQVYTIGNIGAHITVSTKLARVGTGQGATVSAGNSITRLLGTFSKIEHVLLVGVGGSVPDYNNDARHVRRGDVVISKPEYDAGPLYVSLTEMDGDVEAGNVFFGTQTWEARDRETMQVVVDFSKRYSPQSMINSSVNQNIQTVLGEADGQDQKFTRPPADEDRLYKMNENCAWVEVDHPDLAANSPRLTHPDRPVLHFGSIGTGYDQLVSGNIDFRKEFAMFNEIYALDVGYQAVMESIYGNRKDSFLIIRGIADYMDGMGGTEWQPYASLTAAAAMKTLLMRLPAARIY